MALSKPKGGKNNVIQAARKAASQKQKSMAVRAKERSEQVARCDMALGLLPLFCASACKGNRGILNLPLQKWKNGTIQITGPELDASDQDVLYAILAIAMQQYDEKDQPPITEQGSVCKELETKGSAETAVTVSVETGMDDIISMIGISKGGAQRKSIRESIKRLSMIIVEARDGENWAISHLISGAAGYGKNEISIRLNWRLTKALLATGVKGGGSYTAISMVDRRKLSRGVPRLVHSFLCAWYGQPGNHTKLISKRAMAQHVYGPPGDRSTNWRRVQNIQAAYDEITYKLSDWQIYRKM